MSKIVVKQVKDTYEISFRYDPEVLALVKNVPSRRWINERKVWSIPKDKLGFLLAQFKGTVYENDVMVYSEEDLNLNVTMDSTSSIPDIDLSRVPYYVKEEHTPYKHQLDFMKWSIDRQQKGNLNGFLVCDSMGLGKSNEAMNLAIYNKKQYGYKHCLIICCINSSKYNWVIDIHDHTQGQYSAYILGTRWRRGKKSTRSDTGGAEKLADLVTGHMYGKDSEPKLPYFIILNIEALRYRKGKQYLITQELLNWISRGDIGMCIIDEVHKNCSPTSQQGKQLIEMKMRGSQPVMYLPMTGTPIVSRPTDLYLPLKLVEAHYYKSFYAWCNQFVISGSYGQTDVIGYKNIPYLKSMLQCNMIRRLKEEVLDLPPKIHYTEYVENTPYQQKLYQQVAEGIIHNREGIVKSLNPLSQFLRLRQVNGSPELIDDTLKVDSSYLAKNAKLQRLMEILEDVHERGEKCLIFSNWVEPLRTLYRFISKRYKTCCFTGTMDAEVREKHKRVFMTNPEYTVMIGTIGAMGTTHTLTAAQNVIFYDEPWTPSDKEQAEDRAYRIGTTKALKIITLMSKDTVDDRVHDILYTKSGISKFIVDGSLDIRQHPELFDLLMRDVTVSSKR